MRKKQIKGIMHDLLDLNSWRNPLYHITVPKQIKVDLLEGEVLGTDVDDLWKFYHEKIDWFQERINKLGVKEEEFEKAILSISGFKEIVNIRFKGEDYSDEVIFGRQST